MSDLLATLLLPVIAMAPFGLAVLLAPASRLRWLFRTARVVAGRKQFRLRSLFLLMLFSTGPLLVIRLAGLWRVLEVCGCILVGLWMACAYFCAGRLAWLVLAEVGLQLGLLEESGLAAGKYRRRGVRHDRAHRLDACDANNPQTFPHPPSRSDTKYVVLNPWRETINLEEPSCSPP